MAYNGSKAQSGRGTVIGIGPAANTVLPTGCTASTTSGSPSLTSVVCTTGALAVGESITGTGIPAGATVISVGSGIATLSANATATGSAVALTVAIGYTTIGELKTSDQGKPTFDKEDVSNFQSNIDKEYQKEMRDNGMPKFSGNRVGSDAGQMAALAAFNDADNAYMFQVTLPKRDDQTVIGDAYTYNALVMSASFGPVETNKSVPFDMELQITGPRTFTAGS